MTFRVPPDQDAANRRAVIARAVALRDEGRLDEARRLIEDAMPPDGGPRVVPGPVVRREWPPGAKLTPVELRAAERLRKAATVVMGTPAAIEGARSRRVQHVIAILHDTCENEVGMPVTRAAGGRYLAAPVVRNSPKVRWEASLGKMLTAEFRDDPDLTAYEAAAAILIQVRATRRPVRVTKDAFGRWIGQGRVGPARPCELFDLSVAGGQVVTFLGLFNHRPPLEDDE